MSNATAIRLGVTHSQTARRYSLPRSVDRFWMANPRSMMIDSATAKTTPPVVNAVETEAAIGTLTTVATRKISRTRRPFPDTAFADQVSCCQGSHSRANTRAALPIAAHEWS